MKRQLTSGRVVVDLGLGRAEAGDAEALHHVDVTLGHHEFLDAVLHGRVVHDLVVHRGVRADRVGRPRSRAGTPSGRTP